SKATTVTPAGGNCCRSRSSWQVGGGAPPPGGATMGGADLPPAGVGQTSGEGVAACGVTGCGGPYQGGMIELGGSTVKVGPGVVGGGVADALPGLLVGVRVLATAEPATEGAAGPAAATGPVVVGGVEAGCSVGVACRAPRALRRRARTMMALN